MKLEKSCGAVVYTLKNGKPQYVIVQSLEGFYGFPKGHIENNETEKETAIREIYEEVGLRPVFVDGFRIVDEYPISNSRGIIKQVVYFLAEYSDQEICFQKEELLGATLMDFEEAMNVFEESKGSHFEPCIADAVIENKELIRTIDANFKSVESQNNMAELSWWIRYHENLNKKAE